MEKVTREIGRCLTETKRKDFDEAVKRFAEFINVNQFANQPKHISEVYGRITGEANLHIASVLYGIEEGGSLTWLGQIIDSSD